MSGIPYRAWSCFLAAQKQAQADAGVNREHVTALRAQLFDLQLRTIDSPARRQVRKPGRRGGKTKENAIEFCLSACEHPGNEMSLYITLTKHHSRRNLERELDFQIASLSLPIVKSEVDQQLQYKHENGHVIWLTGCKDKGEADKLRGDKYRLAIVDEAGSGLFNRVVKGDIEGSKAITLLQYLCQSVLSPALSDLRGRLVVSGTPWVLPAGFFFEISTGEGGRAKWETWEWTVLDNPFHPHSPLCKDHDPTGFQKEAEEDWGCESYTAEEQAELKKQGVVPLYPGMPWLKKATASFLREWLSQWIRDSEALCYSYAAARNSFFAAAEQGLLTRDAQGAWVFPGGDWRHILTMDIGHNDDTSFTVASSRSGFPHVFYRKSYGMPNMTTSQRVAEAMRLRSKFGISGEVVVDEGALGKAIAEDMRRIYGMPCRPAQKSAKASAIRNLADGQRRGLVFIDTTECEQLVAEWMTVTWNKDRTDHDENIPDDCSDGSLYNFREHGTTEQWDHELPQVGTPERRDYDIERLIEREQEEGELRQLLRGASAADRLDILDQLRESA
jgi:hypothetical protein